MSIHPSLRGASTLVGERSVFTRIERVQKLLREGKLEEAGSPFGLPKVRTRIKVRAAKGPDEEQPAEAAPESDESADS